MSRKHKPEVVVVTGSSGGVGRAVAHAFDAAHAAGAMTGTSGNAAWVRYGIELGARYVYTSLGGVLLPGAREFIAGTQPRS